MNGTTRGRSVVPRPVRKLGCRESGPGPGARACLDKAKELLLNPNYELSEIATELGFGSLGDFETEFARGTGVAVKSYRANQRLFPGEKRARHSA